MDDAASPVSGRAASTSGLALGFGLLLLAQSVRQAWVCDDAFITLRTVDNFVHGRGLVWNVGERVQAYTHPLWMLALTAAYAVGRQPFYAAVTVGLLASLAAVTVLIVRLARTPNQALVVLAALAVSQAFIDYTTSGLENPLTHLVCALFMVAYLREGAPRVGRLALLASLLALTRADAVLLVAPAALHAALVALQPAGGRRRALRALALGCLPFAAWTLFSVLYYGFPWPNTYYAKLGAGIPAVERFSQGTMYLLSNLMHDPTTLATIAAALVLAAYLGTWRHRLLALGVALDVVYVMAIGGDFMQGRFLTAPLFMAAGILAVMPLRLESGTQLASVLVPLVLLGPGTRIGATPVTGGDARGVVDEAAFYRPGSGLGDDRRGRAMPDHEWVGRGWELRNAARRQVQVEVFGNVGFLGFFAGPRVYLIDPNGLTDPLLARLPAMRRPDWRPGHLGRQLPEGYALTLRDQQAGGPYHCRMASEPDLCRYLERLQLVTRGPLLSLARLREIWRFNTGANQALIPWNRYRFPARPSVQASMLSAAVPDGAGWNSPGTTTFGGSGLVVTWTTPVPARQLSVALDRNDCYRLTWYRGTVALGSERLASVSGNGMYNRQLYLPEDAAHQGLDRLVLLPECGDGMYSIGALHLEPLSVR